MRLVVNDVMTGPVKTVVGGVVVRVVGGEVGGVVVTTTPPPDGACVAGGPPPGENPPPEVNGPVVVVADAVVVEAFGFVDEVVCRFFGHVVAGRVRRRGRTGLGRVVAAAARANAATPPPINKTSATIAVTRSLRPTTWTVAPPPPARPAW